VPCAAPKGSDEYLLKWRWRDWLDIKLRTQAQVAGSTPRLERVWTVRAGSR